MGHRERAHLSRRLKWHAARTTYAYDRAGQLLVEMRPNGALRTYTYDQRGNLTAIQTPTGTDTYGWDGENRMVGAVASGDPIRGHHTYFP
jgi:YD repeat-containing protein